MITTAVAAAVTLYALSAAQDSPSLQVCVTDPDGGHVVSAEVQVENRGRGPQFTQAPSGCVAVALVSGIPQGELLRIRVTMIGYCRQRSA